MAAATQLRYACLAFLSKPAEDRRLYRVAKKRRVTRIVELGIGSLARSLNLISVCQRYTPDTPISYTGLDWFEERPAGHETLSLIDAHRQLKAAGAETRLMPGGPAKALPAVANSLLGTDLLLLSPEATDDALAAAWFFLPRILHDGSLILRSAAIDAEANAWVEMPRSAIEAFAAGSRPSLAA